MTKPITIKPFLEISIQSYEGFSLFLRTPLFWDDIQKQWRAFIKTPKTQHIIQPRGKNWIELQNSYETQLAALLKRNNEEFLDEVISMFQPLSYWDEMGEFEE